MLLRYFQAVVLGSVDGVVFISWGLAAQRRALGDVLVNVR